VLDQRAEAIEQLGCLPNTKRWGGAPTPRLRPSSLWPQPQSATY